jgi:hypothetical protein
VSFDADNRLMRYRATPTVCNACPVKETCTTSDNGREMTREVDPWPFSEAGRFHRGIACTIAALAILLPLVTLVPERDPLDAAVLLSTIVLAGVATIPLVSHFWNTPAGFPEDVPLEQDATHALPGRTVDRTVDRAYDRMVDPAVREQPSLIPASRRSVYGSDRLTAGGLRPDRYASRHRLPSTEEEP